MQNLRHSLLGALLVTLAVGPAFGAINTFSNLTEWETAVSSPATLTFDGLSGAYSSLLLGSPDSVTFTALPSGFLDIVASTYGASGCDVDCLYAEATGTASGIRATQNTANVLAIAFNVYASWSVPRDVTINVFLAGNPTPQSYSILPNATNPAAFFGVTSTTNIEKIEIVLTSSSDGHVVIDNYAMATALTDPGPPDPGGEVPEIPTVSFVGLGSLALLYGARKKLLC